MNGELCDVPERFAGYNEPRLQVAVNLVVLCCRRLLRLGGLTCRRLCRSVIFTVVQGLVDGGCVRCVSNVQRRLGHCHLFTSYHTKHAMSGGAVMSITIIACVTMLR